MDKNLAYAAELLKSQNYTCVLYNGIHTFTSKERGVKPLLQWLNEDFSGKGFSAADRVVGKAAAFLYVLLGIKEMHAVVISEAAVATLLKYKITVSYDTLAKTIINRSGTGLCPMEQITLPIEDPREALVAIKAKIKELQERS